MVQILAVIGGIVVFLTICYFLIYLYEKLTDWLKVHRKNHILKDQLNTEKRKNRELKNSLRSIRKIGTNKEQLSRTLYEIEQILREPTDPRVGLSWRTKEDYIQQLIRNTKFIKVKDEN